MTNERLDKIRTARRGAKPGPKTSKPDREAVTVERDSGRGNEIPAMPDPAIYGLTYLDSETLEMEPMTDWPEACQRAWELIWTSELAESFVDSDRLQAEAAIFLLAQAVDPLTQTAQRRTSLKEYQAALEKLGLNPSARSRLKISIANEPEAPAEDPAPERLDGDHDSDGHRAEIVNLYERHASTGSEDYR